MRDLGIAPRAKRRVGPISVTLWLLKAECLQTAVPVEYDEAVTAQ